MYIFTNNDYQRLANELNEVISGSEYFSGNVEFESENADIRFVATLFVYYTVEQFPEGYVDRISNAIPVWWEAHTTTLDGEVLNDFDFSTLKEYLCHE